jgi:hypothetical protein
MKFNKSDIGIIIPGATVNTITEQTFKILEFAESHGFKIDIVELTKAYEEYRKGEWEYKDEEDLGWALEEALEYLNELCTDNGVAFTFRDTDFVLIGGEEFD